MTMMRKINKFKIFVVMLALACLPVSAFAMQLFQNQIFANNRISDNVPFNLPSKSSFYFGNPEGSDLLWKVIRNDGTDLIIMLFDESYKSFYGNNPRSYYTSTARSYIKEKFNPTTFANEADYVLPQNIFDANQKVAPISVNDPNGEFAYLLALSDSLGVGERRNLGINSYITTITGTGKYFTESTEVFQLMSQGRGPKTWYVSSDDANVPSNHNYWFAMYDRNNEIGSDGSYFGYWSQNINMVIHPLMHLDTNKIALATPLLDSDLPVPSSNGNAYNLKEITASNSSSRVDDNQKLALKRSDVQISNIDPKFVNTNHLQVSYDLSSNTTPLLGANHYIQAVLSQGGEIKYAGRVGTLVDQNTGKVDVDTSTLSKGTYELRLFYEEVNEGLTNYNYASKISEPKSIVISENPQLSVLADQTFTIGNNNTFDFTIRSEESHTYSYEAYKIVDGVESKLEGWNFVNQNNQVTVTIPLNLETGHYKIKVYNTENPFSMASSNTFTITVNKKIPHLVVQKDNVEVTASTISLSVGDTINLSLYDKEQDIVMDDPLRIIAYELSSNDADNKIVSVTADGAITGLKKGTAKVLITCKGNETYADWPENDSYVMTLQVSEGKQADDFKVVSDVISSTSSIVYGDYPEGIMIYTLNGRGSGAISYTTDSSPKDKIVKIGNVNEGKAQVQIQAAGIVTIKASIAADSNYQGSTTTADYDLDLRISKKPLKLKLKEGKTILQGQNLPNFEAILADGSSLAYNDEMAELGEIQVQIYDADGNLITYDRTTPAGTYTVKLVGFTTIGKKQENYAISYDTQSVTLTVEPPSANFADFNFLDKNGGILDYETGLKNIWRQGGFQVKPADVNTQNYNQISQGSSTSGFNSNIVIEAEGKSNRMYYLRNSTTNTVSSGTEFSFWIDSTAPTVNTISYQKDGESERYPLSNTSDAQGVFQLYSNKAITLFYDYHDLKSGVADTSGVKEGQFTLHKVDTDGEINSSESIKKVTVENDLIQYQISENGSYRLDIVVSDYAGNTTSKISKYIVIDENGPNAPTVSTKKTSDNSDYQEGTWTDSTLRATISGSEHASGYEMRVATEGTEDGWNVIALSDGTYATTLGGGIDSVAEGIIHYQFRAIWPDGTKGEVTDFIMKHDSDVPPSFNVTAQEEIDGEFSPYSGVMTKNNVRLTFNPTGTLQGNENALVTYYMIDQSASTSDKADLSKWTKITEKNADNKYIYNFTSGINKTFIFKAVSDANTDISKHASYAGLKVFIDKTIETVVTVNGYTNLGPYTQTWSNQDITLEVSGGLEDMSKCIGYEYSVSPFDVLQGNEAWKPITKDSDNKFRIKITQDTQTYYYFRVLTDNFYGTPTKGYLVQRETKAPGSSTFNVTVEKQSSILSIPKMIFDNYFNGDIQIRMEAVDEATSATVDASGLKQFHLIYWKVDDEGAILGAKKESTIPINDEMNATTAYSYEPSEDGNYMASVQAEDKAGNLSFEKQINFVIQRAGPTLPQVSGKTPSQVGTEAIYDHSWTNEQSVSINLEKATEVHHFEWRKRTEVNLESDWKILPDTTLVAQDEGEHTYQFRSVWADGTTSSSVDYVVKIDKSEPNFHVNAISSEEPYTSGTITDKSVAFHFSPIRDVLGLSAIHYYVSCDGKSANDASKTWIAVTNQTYTIENDTKGAKNFDFKAVNEAGTTYVSAQTITVHIERVQLSEVKVSMLSDGKNYKGEWTKNSIMIQVSGGASDPTSIKEYQYCLLDELVACNQEFEWTSMEPTGVLQIDATATAQMQDSTYKFRVKTFSSLTSSSERSYEVHYDNVIPFMAKIDLQMKNDIWASITFGKFGKIGYEAIIEGGDDKTAQDKLQLSYQVVKDDDMYHEDGNWLTYHEALKIMSEGTYEVYGKVCDLAGNCKITKTAQFLIDRTKPSIRGVEEGHAYYLPQKVWLEDDRSGIASYKYQKDNFDVIQGSASTTLFADKGNYSLTLLDRSGNEISSSFRIVGLPNIDDITGDDAWLDVFAEIDQEFAEEAPSYENDMQEKLKAEIDALKDQFNRKRKTYVQDMTSDIVIEGVDGTTFADDILLNVENTLSDLSSSELANINDFIQKETGSMNECKDSFDIYLTRAGIRVTYNGLFKVSIPYTTKIKAYKGLTLFAMDESGTMKLIDYRIQNNQLVYTTTAISKIIIAGKIEKQPDVDTSLPWINIPLNGILLNEDTNDDGVPDINIDTNGDGVPDINIDKNDDSVGDVNLTKIHTSLKPNLCFDSNQDGKDDWCTNNMLVAEINVDSDGDHIADVNLDFDDDFKPDLNISTQGIVTKAEIDIDVNGDGKADVNLDNDKNGKADDKLVKIAHWDPVDIFIYEDMQYGTMVSLKDRIEEDDLDNDNPPSQDDNTQNKDNDILQNPSKPTVPKNTNVKGSYYGGIGGAATGDEHTLPIWFFITGVGFWVLVHYYHKIRM